MAKKKKSEKPSPKKGAPKKKEKPKSKRAQSRGKKETKKAKAPSRKKRKPTVDVSPTPKEVRATDGRKKIAEKRANEIKKERNKFYQAKYRAKKKWKKADTQRARNRYNRQILEAQRQVNELNEELGLIKKFKEVPEKKIEIRDAGAVQESLVAVWEARDKLTELLKGGFFDTYIIGQEEFGKEQVVDIFNEFMELENYAYAYGRKTPYVVFIEDVSVKEVWVNIY